MLFVLDKDNWDEVSSFFFFFFIKIHTLTGLDDLRDWTNNVQPYIPIYVAERDFEV
jgi:hypothetical protein